MVAAIGAGRVRPVDVLRLDARRQENRVKVGQRRGQLLAARDSSQLVAQLAVCEARRVTRRLLAAVGGEGVGVLQRRPGRQLVGHVSLHPPNLVVVLGVDRVNVVGAAAGDSDVGYVLVDEVPVEGRVEEAPSTGLPPDGRDSDSVRPIAVHHGAAVVDERWGAAGADLGLNRPGQLREPTSRRLRIVRCLDGGRCSDWARQPHAARAASEEGSDKPPPVWLLSPRPIKHAGLRFLDFTPDRHFAPPPCSDADEQERTRR